jgi:putative ABC transport system substrate-binding protein
VTAALLRQTRTIPIVFVIVSDPVGSGFVTSLAQPGGNVTGFINMERTIGSKWLELLMEIAPRVKRVAIMFNPETAVAGGTYYLSSIEAAARSLQVDSMVTPVRSDAEIETVITALAREPGGGLVAASDSYVQIHRAPIIAATLRNKVPAVFAETIMVRDGGLVSYSCNYTDIFRRAAAYVDRIFRGEKPEELPVQLPIRFETALNLKTAKALGLDVPPTLLGRADEVIE